MCFSNLHAVLISTIPNGTYPEHRLIDGAVGSSEDVVAAYGWDGFPAGGESNLDFQAAIPLIHPQGTVLFQSDDEFWEENGSWGFFNSKHHRSFFTLTWKFRC